MTAQFSDTVHFRGNQYELAGISGGGLFEPPADPAFQPAGLCTACWRGYVADYAVVEKELRLARVSFISLREPAPTLLGIRPRKTSKKDALFQTVYEAIDQRIDFSGGLLIADGFIEALYIHMGFHPAWKYRRVFELIVHEGRVLEENDHSDAMRDLRERLAGSNEPTDPGNREQVERWINGCFSRRYDD